MDIDQMNSQNINMHVLKPCRNSSDKVSCSNGRNITGSVKMLAVFVTALVLFGHVEAQSNRVKRQDDQTPQLNFEEFKKDVGKTQTDLVVIMDRSFGLGKLYFYVHAKKLARALIERYVVLHPDYVRMAVVTYAADATVDVDSITTPGLNKCQFFHEGPDAPWHKVVYRADPSIGKALERGTNIKAAFKKTREIVESPLNSRLNVSKKVILMLTDGDYDLEEDPYQEREELKEMGYSAYTVGIGTWLAPGNARVLATRPDYYGSFDEWEIFVKGSLRSPESDTDELLVAENASHCNNCSTSSSCYCEVLTGDYLCKCQPGFGYDNNGCTGCPYHQFKSEPGNHGCITCPNFALTRFKNSTSINDCACWEDADCVQIAVNPCDSSPCTGPNEQCIFADTDTYQCQCKPGYFKNTNAVCEKPYYCPVDGSIVCIHGYCVEMACNYTCECDFGYTGRHCDIDIDECRNQPCENGATCEDLVSLFMCNCPPGYKGSYCQDIIPTTTTPSTTTSTTTPSTTSTTQSTATTTEPTTTTEARTTVVSTKAPNVLPVTGISTETIIIIAAAGGGGLLLLILILVLICCVVCRRKKSNPPPVGATNADRPRASSVRFAKRPRGSIYKSISQKFSGVWKKKTMRGGMWVNDDNTKTGAPSAPPKRRPDLISSSLTDPKGHILDEIVVSNDEINEPTGMEGWTSYLEDLRSQDIIDYGTIAHVDGEKAAKTQNYMYDAEEIDKAHDLLMDRAKDIVIKMHGTPFKVESNTGSQAIAKTIEGAYKKQVMLLSNTRKFVVVLVANDDAVMDLVSLEKELQYVVDHINSEGY